VEIHNYNLKMKICQKLKFNKLINLKAHFKTNIHQFWEQNKEKKETLIKINRLEIENVSLRHLNSLLMERIDKVERQLKMLYNTNN